MATSVHASVVLHEQSFPCSALLCLMQNGDCPHPLGRTPAWQQDVTALGRGFGGSWVLSKGWAQEGEGALFPQERVLCAHSIPAFGVPSISGCPRLAGGKNWAKIPSFCFDSMLPSWAKRFADRGLIFGSSCYHTLEW